MDGAASLIAVIQLAGSVWSHCSDYIKAAKNAKQDIERLQGELRSLIAVLENARKLLENAYELKTLQALRSDLDSVLGNCSSHLKDLESKLEDNLGNRKRDKIAYSLKFRSLKWPFESNEVNNIIQNLHRFREMLSTGINIDQTTLLLDNLVLLESDERRKILDWISKVPFGKHHDTVKEARTLNTCEWLLRHEKFREWENSDSSVILWLQGSPGAGKTFLASKVIDHAEDLLKASSCDEGFAFFYCNRNETDRRDPLSVLRSYLRQLSTSAGNFEYMQKKLQELHSSAEMRISDMRLDTCREQLIEAVNTYQKTTLVLDALDECEPESRSLLMETIEFLLLKSKKPVKVFISSRRERDIQNRFRDKANIEIQARHNEEDIRNFVSNEIVKHGNWKGMSLQLKKDIINVLLERSGEMFQWVSLQVKQILDLETEKAIRDRLGKLPTGLEKTYDEIYGKIQARNEYDKSLADRALMWVMCSYQPLRSQELLSAIRLNSEDAFGLDNEINESQLLHLCNNLLVLDSQRRVWRFSHLSVVEYFENNHWSLRQTHCYIAKICLKLLMETSEVNLNSDSEASDDDREDDSENQDIDILNPNHPVQKYSRHHWVYHVQTQEGQETDPTLVKALKAFLGSPNESSAQYQKWYRHVKFDGWRGRPRTSCFYKIGQSDISPRTSSSLAMCRFSFYTLLLDWWHGTEIQLSQVNAQGDSLLVLAAIAGCKPICAELINRGIDVNFQTGEYGSPLAAAAYWENTDIVKFLIEKGADVGLLQTGNYGSALAALAAGSGYAKNFDTISRFMIEEGADVDLALLTGNYGSTLAAAAGHIKDVDIVKMLIDQGADVDQLLQTGEYGSALATAAYWGNFDLVKLLVEKGANVDLLLHAGEYGSALAAAAANAERFDIVKFLIEKGANINLLLQTGAYGSALATASYWGNLDIVKFLVAKGANVDLLLETGEYGSALAAAAAATVVTEGKWDKIEVVRFLVHQGADVNLLFQTGEYGSALAAAAATATWGGLDIVGFLVHQGAVVNQLLHGGKYGSALAAAASNAAIWAGLDILGFLIRQKANVNLLLESGHYGSALSAAAYWGHREYAQILINSGAKVKLRLENRTYATALHASQVEVHQHDLENQLWPRRTKDKIKRDKYDVEKLLGRAGANE